MDHWQELVTQLKDILPEENDQRILLALKQNGYDIERAAEALMTGTVVDEVKPKKDNNSHDKNKLNPRQTGRSRTPERKRSDPPQRNSASPRKTGGWAGINSTEPDPSKSLPQYQKRVDPLYFKKGDFPQLSPVPNTKSNEGNATVDFLQQIFGTRVSRDALVARLNGHQGQASSALESLLAEEGGADDEESNNQNGEENEPLFDKSIIEQQKKMAREEQSSRLYEPSRASMKRHPTVPPPSGRLAKTVMMSSEQMKALVLENTTAQDIYHEARREAVKRFKAYNNACRQATRAYERESHSEAREATQRARDLRAQAVDMHDEAASKIYATNNHHREKNEVDLHGLHAEEALMVLAIKLQALALEDPPTVKELRVITGIGVHQTGRAILGPAVEHFLIEHKCKYTTPRPGMVLVTVKYIEVAF